MYTRINPQIGDLLKAIDHILHHLPSNAATKKTHPYSSCPMVPNTCFNFSWMFHIGGNGLPQDMVIYEWGDCGNDADGNGDVNSKKILISATNMEIEGQKVNDFGMFWLTAGPKVLTITAITWWLGGPKSNFWHTYNILQPYIIYIYTYICVSTTKNGNNNDMI